MRSLVVLSLLALAPCQPEAAPPPVPGSLQAEGALVATVVDIEVTQDMVDVVEKRIPPDQLERMKAMGRYSEFLDRIMVGQALYKKALDKGIHEDP